MGYRDSVFALIFVDLFVRMNFDCFLVGVGDFPRPDFFPNPTIVMGLQVDYVKLNKFSCPIRQKG